MVGTPGPERERLQRITFSMSIAVLVWGEEQLCSRPKAAECRRSCIYREQGRLNSQDRRLVSLPPSQVAVRFQKGDPMNAVGDWLIFQGQPRRVWIANALVVQPATWSADTGPPASDRSRLK